MISARQLRKTFSVVLMICGLMIGSAFISPGDVQVLAQPLVAVSLDEITRGFRIKLRNIVMGMMLCPLISESES